MEYGRLGLADGLATIRERNGAPRINDGPSLVDPSGGKTQRKGVGVIVDVSAGVDDGTLYGQKLCGSSTR